MEHYLINNLSIFQFIFNLISIVIIINISEYNVILILIPHLIKWKIRYILKFIGSLKYIR